jgi:L-threonylcarbamoyladenylate synthase
MSEELEACIAAGGVAVFGADTVYGLACDPRDKEAIARLYALKGRAQDKPAAVMLFSLAGLPELAPRTAQAARRLLPGALTLLVPSPAFPLAGGRGVLGLRVPDVPSLAGVGAAVLQTSANHAGDREARRLADVPADIRRGADLVLDAGELPGMPSTIVDLTRFEQSGTWSIVRAGAVPEADVGAALDPRSAR